MIRRALLTYPLCARTLNQMVTIYQNPLKNRSLMIVSSFVIHRSEIIVIYFQMKMYFVICGLIQKLILWCDCCSQSLIPLLPISVHPPGSCAQKNLQQARSTGACLKRRLVYEAPRPRSRKAARQKLISAWSHRHRRS